MEKLKQGIQEVEVAADAFKLAKAKGIDLDRRRQGNRECLAALRRQDKGVKDRSPGDEKPPANAFVFSPGQVIVRMPREAAKALVEKDQEAVEGKIRANEQALKRALRDLSDKGGVPDTVGAGLLNAFVNLKDNTNTKREVDSNDDDQ